MVLRAIRCTTCTSTTSKLFLKVTLLNWGTNSSYSYGQYTTISDRIFGSYRKPNIELFIKDKKMSEEEWSRQQKEMEDMVQEVEHGDDRVYLNQTKGKKNQ
jgi:hypothetical protein